MSEIEQAWNEAVADAEAGRFAEADAACARILAADPDNADTWHLRAEIAMTRGGKGGPESPGSAAQAAEYCRQALVISPAEARYHYSLGLALRRAGDPDGAVAALRQARSFKAEFAEASFELAAVFEDAGDLPAAAECYEQACRERPGFVEAHHNLAGIYRRLGRPADAVEQGQIALALAHDNPVIRFSLGVSLEQTGTIEDAIGHYREALRLRPRYLQAQNNLGRLLELTGNFVEALELLEEAAARAPDDSAIATNLGNAYLRLGRHGDAIGALNRAAELSPDLAAVHNSLGVGHAVTGEPTAAIAAYRRAIDLNAEFAEAHENLALILLRSGNFTDGWVEYEWRWKNPANELTKRTIARPMWEGGALDGRTLLLHAEQGLGDSLQMIRYADLIDKSGGRIVLTCQPPLIRLLTEMAAIDEVVALDHDWPDCDCQAPLFSLPRIFATTLDTVPAETPYIAWRTPPAEPAGHRAIRVGFAWAGRPKHAEDPARNRSCPVERFVELAGTADVELFSFQREPERHQLAAFGDQPNLFDLGADHADFADDARALNGMDLVISVDTAIAHLAGAMNIPCWLILPHAADWRWLQDRHDTPWYPSARLFRQQQPGDWQGVFGAVRQALSELIESRRHI